jgi:DNA-binding winged helix-turn-helix (wHTH) protein/TolB-like protein
MSEMAGARFRFGLYEFDAAKLELRREGMLVRLPSQPAQLLASLLERADQVVSRDELRAALWGDKTFVDFENGLNFCISQVRSALQDDPAQPRYIRTIPKKGYQFIAPVQRPVQSIDAESSVCAAQQGASGGNAWMPRRIAVALGLAGLAALAVLGLRFRSVQSGSQAPILAVARFDNETGDPALVKFADALTDEVVVQLTSRSKSMYRVIGNAQILQLPREQRDLKAIATALNAEYVVLGQVQDSGAQVRVLAHLIRLSDQTHIWVTRVGGTLGEPLNLESEIADKIAVEFSARMSSNPNRAASFPSGSR